MNKTLKAISDNAQVEIDQYDDSFLFENEQSCDDLFNALVD